MAKAFRVLMTGNQEVPPNNSTAAGLGTVIFNSTAIAAFYSIRLTGLDFGPALNLPEQTTDPTDNVTSFHVHNAPRGVNGPVVFGQINPSQDLDDLRINLNNDASWTVRGRWEPTDPPSPAGATISTFADALNAAPIGSDVSLYFNAHTTEFPAGEIRGQWVAIADDTDNTVQGTSGDDLLPGFGGDDRLSGAEGNDRLEGNAGRDTLSGGSGDDTLLGGRGNDLLGGGSGNDRMDGDSGNDRLFGNVGDDRMNGGFGDDRLTGGDGNDRMAGSAGDDRLSGGNGDDRLNGGSGRDALNGGSGRDDLNGGGGIDILVGGANADTFTFSTALGAGNVDTVQGYSVVSDTIQLDSDIFTGLSTGALSADAFHVGASAAEANDRIIYNDENGALFFDADGNATGVSQVQFATLLGTPELTRFDLVVI